MKMLRQNQLKKGRKEHQVKRTILRASNLKNIFSERKNVFLGLTKLELISLYKEIKFKTILKWNQSRIDSVWNEIRLIKKYLTDKDGFLIIFKSMERGTKIQDKDFGTRILDKKENIFFRAWELSDGFSYKNFIDKIGNGIIKTSEKVSDILENQEKEKPLLKLVKN